MTVQNITVETRVDEGEFQTEQVLTISSGHFVHDVYSAFLAPLLPLLIEKMSLTLTLAGSLSAFMQLPAILTPFIGHLADKYNLRYLVIIAPALTATAMSAMGLAPNYATLALLLILAGISSAIFHAPAPAMVGQISGKRVGKGMSWFMGGGELARTVGPIVAVWAVSSWALEGMFRVVVIGWATSAILFWRLRDIPISARKNGSLQSILAKIADAVPAVAHHLFFSDVHGGLYDHIFADLYEPERSNIAFGWGVPLYPGVGRICRGAFRRYAQ